MENPTDDAPLVARITGFNPIRFEITGAGPYPLPISIGFPPLKIKVIDLDWAVKGAYIGGDGEILRQTISGAGEMTVEQVVKFITLAADDLKRIFDIYQEEIFKVELLK